LIFLKAPRKQAKGTIAVGKRLFVAKGGLLSPRLFE